MSEVPWPEIIVAGLPGAGMTQALRLLKLNLAYPMPIHIGLTWPDLMDRGVVEDVPLRSLAETSGLLAEIQARGNHYLFIWLEATLDIRYQRLGRKYGFETLLDPAMVADYEAACFAALVEAADDPMVPNPLVAAELADQGINNDSSKRALFGHLERTLQYWTGGVYLRWREEGHRAPVLSSTLPQVLQKTRRSHTNVDTSGGEYL